MVFQPGHTRAQRPKGPSPGAAVAPPGVLAHSEHLPDHTITKRISLTGAAVAPQLYATTPDIDGVCPVDRAAAEIGTQVDTHRMADDFPHPVLRQRARVVCAHKPRACAV